MSAEKLDASAREYKGVIEQYGFLRYGRDVSLSLLTRAHHGPYKLRAPLIPSYTDKKTPPFMQFLEAAQTGGMLSIAMSSGSRTDGARRLLSLAPSQEVDSFLADLGLDVMDDTVYEPKDQALLFAYQHASLAVGFLRNYGRVVPDESRIDERDKAARAFIRSLREQLSHIMLFSPNGLPNAQERYSTYEYWQRGTTQADWLERLIAVKDLVHTALFTTDKVRPERAIDAANFFNVLEALYCILYLDQTLGKADERYPKPRQ